MLDLNYGVVEIAGRWTVISQGLRFGSFETAAEAEAIARNLADQAAGLPVGLHIQDSTGELRRAQPSA
jgi:hypothetical protein